MAWIGGAIAAGGAVLGGLLSSNAASNAAQTQAGAAGQAAQVQQNMFNRTQANLAPWMQEGRIALADLSNRLGLTTISPNATFAPPAQNFGRPGGFLSVLADRLQAQQQQAAATAAGTQTPLPPDANTGSLLKPFTLADFQASPAYQFNLQQGQQAIDKAAASREAFYQPGTLQDIARFSQGLASNEFQNAFSNYNTNMGNIWNRLFALSGSGQNAAANLGGFGTTVAGNIGNDITGAANASAAGTIGSANAINSSIGGVGNTILLSQLLRGQQQSNYAPLVQDYVPGQYSLGNPQYGGGP